MEKRTDEVVLFNSYRDAELRGADLVLRLMNHADTPDLQEPLTRHLADEARHAWLWTERIRALGGQLVHTDDSYHRYLRRKAGLPTNLLELIALNLIVEERMNSRYEEHAARADVDPETRRVLNGVQADEEWYLTWLAERLQEFEQSEGREKVAAALAHYRALEAEAFATTLK